MKTASLAQCEFTAKMSGPDFRINRNGRIQNHRSFWRAISVYSSAGAIVLSLALLTACSSETNKPEETTKPEAKGPELITARSAFQKLYVAARGWSQDQLCVRLEPQYGGVDMARHIRREPRGI